MSLQRTPFFQSHVDAGARLIDFGGWEMPVQYAGIIPEHRAVRAGVGLFDVSHMGEIRVTGPKANEALNAMTTNDVRSIPVGGSQYSGILNHDGGFVDDIFVYRLGANELFVCVNASNQEKDFAWFVENNPFEDGGEATFTYESTRWAQLAIQGRHGAAVVYGLTDVDALAMGRGEIARGAFAGVEGCMLARTGYTGEDGFEVFIPWERAAPTWDRVMAAGANYGIVPVGLGARDTLRLEVKNVLYGNDIGADTTPFQARLRWITKLDKGEFIGREALLAEKASGVPRILVGIVVEKRIARAHSKILTPDGEEIGEVTSGTRSPSLGTNIAMGYVRRGFGRPGTPLLVDVRGRQAKAAVVKGPFYQRDY